MKPDLVENVRHNQLVSSLLFPWEPDEIRWSYCCQRWETPQTIFRLIVIVQTINRNVKYESSRPAARVWWIDAPDKRRGRVIRPAGVTQGSVRSPWTTYHATKSWSQDNQRQPNFHRLISVSTNTSFRPRLNRRSVWVRDLFHFFHAFPSKLLLI